MKTVEEWTLDPSTVKLLNMGKKMAGTVIRCCSGSLWVTQEGDSRDHLLSGGEEFLIETPGAVVVQAFTPALVQFGPRSSGSGSQESLERTLFERGERAA